MVPPVPEFGSNDSTVNLFPRAKISYLATGRGSYVGSACVDFSLENSSRPSFTMHR
jgi:hypothetical protein